MHKQKYCPDCSAKLPKYASYTKDVISVALNCPNCNVLLYMEKPKFKVQKIERLKGA